MQRSTAKRVSMLSGGCCVDFFDTDKNCLDRQYTSRMESNMLMKTVVMTGGTAGFGAVAAKRISNTPNTKLIVGARDNKNSSIDTLPLDLARLSNVRSFVQSLTKKLDGAKIDILIMNAGAQFGT